MRNWILLLTLTSIISGCGYTQQTVLPRNIKTIHIDTIKNKIPVGEVYAYHPGLEVDIRNAIVRRLQKDGNLKVVDREAADAILEADLIRFHQEGLRFTSLESVEEYRLYIILSMRLIDGKKGDEIFSEPEFSGDSEYFVSDVRSIAREEAARQAIDQLAVNVVDRIVEDW